MIFLFFFFNDTATTEIYTLSLHDALPISGKAGEAAALFGDVAAACVLSARPRSEEHTSELQSRFDLVCRLLLEKKKKKTNKQSCTLNTNVLTNTSLVRALLRYPCVTIRTL